MLPPSRDFVAGKLWLLVAIVTLPLAGLTGVLGMALALPEAFVVSVVATIGIGGWFLLTPLLLFFGDEFADALVGPADAKDGHGNVAAGEEPIETLKRRYAAGELDEAAFERRLEQLLALDEITASESDLEPLLSDVTDEDIGRDRTDSSDRERATGTERILDRE